MLLSESKRDEYVTHLALDLGYNNDEIRKAVEEAGFEPLPEEDAAKQHAHCIKQMQEDLAVVKQKFAKYLHVDKFDDFAYDGSNWAMTGFTFTVKNVNYTCFGSAYNNYVETYTILPTDELDNNILTNSIVVQDYEYTKLADKFIKRMFNH